MADKEELRSLRNRVQQLEKAFHRYREEGRGVVGRIRDIATDHYDTLDNRIDAERSAIVQLNQRVDNGQVAIQSLNNRLAALEARVTALGG